MRAIEFILEKLNETVLFEMAYSQQHAKNFVTGASSEIFEHMIKLFVCNVSYDTKQYWIKEINNKWLRKIDSIRLKSKNKKVSSELLARWMFEDAGPHYDVAYVQQIIDHLKEDEYLLHTNLDLEEILQRIFSILSRICEDISANNFTKLSDYLD